jgi:NADPH:quinone reductase-like Zn-dependent oxidoreductase
LEDGPWRAVGGPVDGVLREYAVFDQKYLVHLPEHLSWEEVRLPKSCHYL